MVLFPNVDHFHVMVGGTMMKDLLKNNNIDEIIQVMNA